MKPTKLTNVFTLENHRNHRFATFTPPGILKRFVENTWWEHIATKDSVVQLVRAHFASRHPKNNNVSLKAIKSDSSRQTCKKTWPITSYPLPIWEEITILVEDRNEEIENIKYLHLHSRVLRCKITVLHQREPIFCGTWWKT